MIKSYKKVVEITFTKVPNIKNSPLFEYNFKFAGIFGSKGLKCPTSAISMTLRKCGTAFFPYEQHPAQFFIIFLVAKRMEYP
jgi:hypothetical protein